MSAVCGFDVSCKKIYVRIKVDFICSITLVWCPQFYIPGPVERVGGGVVDGEAGPVGETGAELLLLNQRAAAKHGSYLIFDTIAGPVNK